MKYLILSVIALFLLTSCATIHSSAEKGDINSVKDYLNNGTDIDKKNGDNATPLMMAVRSNNPELVSYLIDKGADVNAKDEDGYTAIMYTKYMMLRIYALKAQKEYGDYSGDYFPIENNWKYDCLDKDCRDKDYSFSYFPSALYWSKKDILEEWKQFHKYKKDLYNIVKLLVEKGTDTNILANDNDSILNYAIYFDMFRISELLLQNGADADAFFTNVQTKETNIPDKYIICNYTTLIRPYIRDSKNYCKVQAVCYEQVNYCLENTNVDTIYSKMTMLSAASAKGDIEMIEKLVKKEKANVNIKNKENETPIFFAVRNAQIKSIKKLIEFGADLNIVNKDGHTPLILALTKKRPNGKIIKTLIDSGADTKFTVDNSESNYDNMTVVEIAAEKKITIKVK